MSQELLYTSAPHGLKPGSRGFCTVLSTQGMSAPLATALESLSGYRPVYPPSDERAELNPVAFSHLKVQVAGKSWHVLSRVADYGLDYSQRTNKLAHHVVLDANELVEAGPAQLLALPQFMRNKWDGESKLVAPKPQRKVPPVQGGLCHAWKDLAGDAGWAGVLAESYLKDPERPVILLFEPGYDLLPLLAESISLLPPERRWEVTFSTYFTGLPQGVACAWRCLLKDSPEAHQSLRFAKALRIDLTNQTLGPATGGNLVQVARGKTRQITTLSTPQDLTEATTKKSNEVEMYDRASSMDADRTSSGAETGDTGRPTLPPELNVQSHDTRNRLVIKTSRSKRTLADVDRELVVKRRLLRFAILKIVLAIIVFVVIAAIAFAFWMRKHGQENKKLNGEGASTISNETQRPKKTSGKRGKTPAKKEFDSPATNPVQTVDKPIETITNIPAVVTPTPPNVEQAVDTTKESVQLPVSITERSVAEDLKSKGVLGFTYTRVAEVDSTSPENVALRFLQPRDNKLELRQKPMPSNIFQIGKTAGSDGLEFQVYCSLQFKQMQNSVIEIKLLSSAILLENRAQVDWCVIDIHDKEHPDNRVTRLSFNQLAPTRVLDHYSLARDSEFKIAIPLSPDLGHAGLPTLKYESLKVKLKGNDTFFELSSDKSTDGNEAIKSFLNANFFPNEPKLKTSTSISVMWSDKTTSPMLSIQVKFPYWDEVLQETHNSVVAEQTAWTMKLKTLHNDIQKQMKDSNALKGLLTIAEKSALPNKELPDPQMLRDEVKNLSDAIEMSSSSIPAMQVEPVRIFCEDTTALQNRIELYHAIEVLEITQIRVYYELFDKQNLNRPAGRRYLVDAVPTK